MRELIILGTSSQVPTKDRNHNGYFLRWDSEGLLFDPGEGTQRQTTIAGLASSSITKICISHFHGDHCLGLAGVIQRISLDNVERQIDIFFPQSGEEYFKSIKESSIFYDTTSLIPRPISGDEELVNKPFILQALKLDHSVDTFGYRLIEPDGITMLPEKLEYFGIKGAMIKELIKTGTISVNEKTVTLQDVSKTKKGQVFSFIMDTKICDNAYKLAENADLILCEATYLDSEKESAKNNGHLTASQAAIIAKESNAGTLVLSHFSPRYTDLTPFLEEASKYHNNVVIAKDCEKISFPDRK